MTGFDAAAEWLQANAPKWRIEASRSSLHPGGSAGAPTIQRVSVVLVQVSGDMTVSLQGDGVSHIAAVQAAVGGLHGSREGSRNP